MARIVTWLTSFGHSRGPAHVPVSLGCVRPDSKPPSPAAAPPPTTTAPRHPAPPPTPAKSRGSSRGAGSRSTRDTVPPRVKPNWETSRASERPSRPSWTFSGKKKGLFKGGRKESGYRFGGGAGRGGAWGREGGSRLCYSFTRQPSLMSHWCILWGGEESSRDHALLFFGAATGGREGGRSPAIAFRSRLSVTSQAPSS